MYFLFLSNQLHALLHVNLLPLKVMAAIKTWHHLLLYKNKNTNKPIHWSNRGFSSFKVQRRALNCKLTFSGNNWKNLLPQLLCSRFYWKADKATAITSIADADTEYCYEYLGVKERLVVTPLTDRCYITLSQVCVGRCCLLNSLLSIIQYYQPFNEDIVSPFSKGIYQKGGGQPLFKSSRGEPHFFFDGKYPVNGH